MPAMPAMPAMPSLGEREASGEHRALGAVAQIPRPTLLTDADDSGFRTQRPAVVPPPAVFEPAEPTLLAPAVPPAVPSAPLSPFEAPPPPVHNPALNERTDPDASRPLRIEAQKDLPAVKALMAAGLVSIEQVETAAVEQASRGGRTIEILVAHGACTDAAVADVLAAATRSRRLADDELVVGEQALLKRLPQTYALARRLLPITMDTGNLVLAVADPFDHKVIGEVKDLVHALNVDVRVAARAALTQATLKAFADLHGATVAASGPRVLLGIQDDAKAQTLGARLVQEGMQVEHVVDGSTARTIVQSRPPDAVICTWDLPGVDGQGVLLAARNAEKTLELPVFIIGPRSDDDLMAKVLDLGADDYFGEPVRPDVVVAKLRRAIGKMQGRQTLPPAAAPVMVLPPPTQPQAKKSPAQPSVLPSTDDFAFDDLPDLPPEFDGNASPEVAAMPTGVMGTLRQMSLPEIVQSLEMGRKTAIVDVVPQDGEKGAIGFEGGAVRFAECGPLLGNDAFFALMRHKEGFFRIHYGDAPKSLNIDAPTTYLLLEAMRLMDEEGQ
jgi:CheY-like chemotaxis protein